jgi:site-specific recombinase XerD
MPRKPLATLEHVKTVKRNGVSYLYFNTGEKRDNKAVYTALGRAGSMEVGQRYSAALALRTRRGGSPSSVLVPDLVKLYERSAEFTKHSVGTQTTYMVYHRRMAKEFNTAPAGCVESSDIYRLMDKMAATPAAVDMLILAGKQMFTWAKKRRYVAANPFLEVDREDWATQQYQPWPEQVLVAGLADERLWLAVALLYYTGQRIGDCCKMEWKHITEGVLYVKQQKTKKELWVPIHAELAATLARVERTSATILTSPRGGPAKDPTLRDWIKDFGKGFELDLVPHGLRKNAVNALLESECSTGEVSSITGQSLKMVELYAAKRNNRKMAGAAMAKWERATNRETTGKIRPELAE